MSEQQELFVEDGYSICMDDKHGQTCVVATVSNDFRDLSEILAAAPKFKAALEQIQRLAREADRETIDVASMLGDIAGNALAA